jgi:hypothetical protein
VKLQKCSRPDCPYNSSLLCLQVPGTALCACHNQFPCKYIPAIGGCSRIDSPGSNGTKLCLRVSSDVCSCSPPCAFNPQTQQCTRPDCPTNPQLLCQHVPGTTTCACANAPTCSYNAAANACSQTTCPNDPSKACLLFPATAASPANCNCVTPCRYDVAAGSCTRPDCPNNAALKCVQVPGAVPPTCSCLDGIPCTFVASTNSCSRPDCPTNSSKYCLPINVNGNMSCQCGEPVVPCAFDPATQQCTRPDCPTNPQQNCTRVPGTVTCSCTNSQPCFYNAAVNSCSQMACPNDPSKQCLLTQPSSCSCSIPCVFNQTIGTCSRDDCPTNSSLRCLQIPGTFVCSCLESTPCQYNPWTGACSRTNCPNDPTKLCLRVPNVPEQCACQDALCLCQLDAKTGLCTTDTCPNLPGTKCVKVQLAGAGPVCHCIGNTLALSQNLTSLLFREQQSISVLQSIMLPSSCNYCWNPSLSGEKPSNNMVAPMFNISVIQGTVCAALVLGDASRYWPLSLTRIVNEPSFFESFFDQTAADVIVLDALTIFQAQSNSVGGTMFSLSNTELRPYVIFNLLLYGCDNTVTTIVNVTGSLGTDSLIVDLLKGDVNGDGIVNLGDIIVILDNWKQHI